MIVTGDINSHDSIGENSDSPIYKGEFIQDNTINDYIASLISQEGGAENIEGIEKIINKLELGEQISKSEVKFLYSKITLNNPALGIFDNLEDKDSFQSIIFTGIKKVNDTFSQAFTDSILDNLKKEIIIKYPESTPIWNDYKNFVIKMREGVNFPSQKELNEMLQKNFEFVISQLETDKLKKITDEIERKNQNIPKLGIISETGKIEGNSQKEIMFSLAKTRSNLEKKVLGDIVLNKKELIDKLGEVYDKYNLQGDFEEIMIDERGRTKYTTKAGVLTKEFIVEETGKKVINRTLILDSDGNINLNIINLVRKNLISSTLQIYKDINQIIKSAIANGEFIGPYISKDGLPEGYLISKESLNTYQNIKKKIENGDKLSKYELIALKEMGEKTYKNSLNKEVFYHKIDKPGELFFIDIVGMGNINIADFLNKLKKNNAGEISEEELFLTSGSLMTERFQKLLVGLKKDIQEQNLGKKINFYIGGDEIGIFVEGIEKSNNNDTVKNINTQLKRQKLEGRITKKLVQKEDIKKGGEKLFEEIDKLTKYSKIIENRIDETIQEIKVLKKEKWVKNSARKISTLKILKKFDISILDGKEMITFHPPSWFTLFEKGNIFELEQIIDLETLKLKPYPSSPFIKYLKEHNLER